MDGVAIRHPIAIGIFWAIVTVARDRVTVAVGINGLISGTVVVDAVVGHFLRTRIHSSIVVVAVVKRFPLNLHVGRVVVTVAVNPVRPVAVLVNAVAVWVDSTAIQRRVLRCTVVLVGYSVVVEVAGITVRTVAVLVDTVAVWVICSWVD